VVNVIVSIKHTPNDALERIAYGQSVQRKLFINGHSWYM